MGLLSFDISGGSVSGVSKTHATIYPIRSVGEVGHRPSRACRRHATSRIESADKPLITDGNSPSKRGRAKRRQECGPDGGGLDSSVPPHQGNQRLASPKCFALTNVESSISTESISD